MSGLCARHSWACDTFLASQQATTNSPLLDAPPLSLAATPNLTHTAGQLYTSNPYTAHCRKRQIFIGNATI